jgi:hypothetical protein
MVGLGLIKPANEAEIENFIGTTCVTRLQADCE